MRLAHAGVALSPQLHFRRDESLCKMSQSFTSINTIAGNTDLECLGSQQQGLASNQRQAEKGTWDSQDAFSFPFAWFLAGVSGQEVRTSLWTRSSARYQLCSLSSNLSFSIHCRELCLMPLLLLFKSSYHNIRRVGTTSKKGKRQTFSFQSAPALVPSHNQRELVSIHKVRVENQETSCAWDTCCSSSARSRIFVRCSMALLCMLCSSSVPWYPRYTTFETVYPIRSARLHSWSYLHMKMWRQRVDDSSRQDIRG